MTRIITRMERSVVLMCLWLFLGTSIASNIHEVMSTNHNSLLFVIPATTEVAFTEEGTNNSTQLKEKHKYSKLTVELSVKSEKIIPSEEQVTGNVRNATKTETVSGKYGGYFSEDKPASRQFIQPNNNRFNSNGNQIAGGTSNQIMGSNPQTAIEMVQSYVENVINNPDPNRPGYIMINSANSAIIGQLADALAQQYGTSSVISDPETLQNFLSEESSVENQRFQAQTTTESNNMPVFPFNSHYTNTINSESTNETISPETEFIRQQLSAIADVSVSSGKLINDTVENLPTVDLNPTPTPVIHFNESVALEQSSFEPFGNNNDGNITNSANAGLQNISNSMQNSEYIKETNVQNQDKISVQNQDEKFFYSNLVNKDSMLNNAQVPNSDSQNHISPNNYSSSNNVFDMDATLVTGNLANQFQEAQLLHNEDYYEEIDGEMVLSPTKFMRKAVLTASTDYNDYEYPEHDNDDKNEDDQLIRTSFPGENAISKGNSLPENKIQNTLKDNNSPEYQEVNLDAFINGSDQFSSNQGYYFSKPSGDQESVNPSNMEQIYDVIPPSYVIQNHNGNQAINSAYKDHKTQHINSDYPNHQTTHVENSQTELMNPSMPSSPKNVINHLMEMSKDDLKVLGISDDMPSIINQLNNTENRDLSQSIQNDKDGNTNINYISARPSFSAGNFRQSDINQQAPTNFFPTRPPLGFEHTHHHGSHNEHESVPQLTPEQEQIISRLPVGMQHVVTSIVQAVQAPLQTTTTTTTTQTPQYPFLYPIPHPYPYPYPPYPYLPQLNPQQQSNIQQSTVPQATSDTPQNAHQHHDHSHGEDHGSGHHTANNIQDSHGSSHSHGTHQNTGDTHNSHTRPIISNGHGHHNHHHASHGHHGSHHDNHAHNDESHINQGTPASHHTHHTHAADDVTSNSNQSIDNNSNQQSEPSNGNGDISIQSNQIVSSTQNPPSSTSASTDALIQLQEHSIHSTNFTFRPAVNPIFSQSRFGEAADQSDRTSGNDNQRPNNGQSCSDTGLTGGACHSRISLGGTPSRPDRNQGLLALHQDGSHMGNSPQTNSGIVRFRPPQQTNMQMGQPVVNVVLPEITRSTTEEPGPLIDPNPPERTTQDQPNQNQDSMNRQEMNSLLQSLFSSPTLLLLGIVFATSAAYMAIAMEEQAVQQQFQQAQLAAAFGGQPFPGRRRRREIFNRLNYIIDSEPSPHSS